ncbi:hypothetical protein HMPREF0262_03361 [Clostridium sp. ATCC 29733]|nr:hypothetical protein HMPREF0262_03361 [Clostridium sp. ATCC 29733]
MKRTYALPDRPTCAGAKGHPPLSRRLVVCFECRLKEGGKGRKVVPSRDFAAFCSL